MVRPLSLKVFFVGRGENFWARFLNLNFEFGAVRVSRFLGQVFLANKNGLFMRIF